MLEKIKSMLLETLLMLIVIGTACGILLTLQGP